MPVLVIFVICLCAAFILGFFDVYKFFPVEIKVQMTRKKRKRVDGDPTFRLQIYKFTKLYNTRNNNSDPKPRSGHRIECTDSSVYSVGGFRRNTTDELFCEVWRFDLTSKTWLKLDSENLPKELASCTIILSGTLLFLYGGTDIPFGRNLNESLYFCNLPKSGNSITFEEIKATTFVSPPARYGHSMVLNGKYIYVVGGTTGHMYSMDVYAFNMHTSEWEKLYDCFHENDGPTSRYRHEMVHYKDRLYVFGGGTSNYACTLEVIPAFDLKTKSWLYFRTIRDESDEEGFPVNRKCHGCVQDPHVPSIAYINGGLGQDMACRDTWRIDLDTLKWTRIQSMNLPYGTYFHSVAATPDGRMVVFGGITDKNTPPERTADLYSAWITIPKLSDACWEAVIHYLRNGVFTWPRDVRCLGLPKKYEERLISSGFSDSF